MNTDPFRHQYAPAGCLSLPLRRRNGQIHGYTLVDADTPDEIIDVRWSMLVSPNGCRAVRTVHSRGIGSQPKLLLLHRVILQPPASMDVDHINRDSLDNRRANLRPATASQNGHNCPMRATNRTGYKGVSPCGFGRFQAIITVEGRRIYIGKYATAAEAALAYNAIAAEHLGEFALLNQVEGAVA